MAVDIQRKGGTKEGGASVPARLGSPTRVGDVVRRSSRGRCHDKVITKGAHLHPLRGGVHAVLGVEADQEASGVKKVGPATVWMRGEGRRERPWGPQHHRGGWSCGQGRDGGGAHVLNLRKQETLKPHKIVRSDTTTLRQGMASEPAALSNPVPPVLQEPGGGSAK